MESKNSLVLVLGMHRSGTSVVTRGLKVLGVNLGDKAQEQGHDNEKGFWEDSDFKKLNIEMLEVLENDWDSVEQVTEADVSLLNSKGYLERAVSLLESKTQGSSVFGLKDPRTSKLLAFWIVVLERLDLDVRYVICVRNPLSVEASLSVRNSMNPAKSFLLWLDYTISALHYTQKSQRVIVDYDRLVSAPDVELLRISQTLSLSINQVDLSSYKEGFIDKSLRHSKHLFSDLKVGSECPDLVVSVSKFLARLVDDQMSINSSEALGEINKWWQDWSEPFSHQEFIRKVYRKENRNQRIALLNLTADLERKKNEVVSQELTLEKERQAFEAKRNKLTFELSKKEIELDSLYGSNSWRLTKPVRSLSTFFRKSYKRIPLPSSVKRINRNLYNKLTQINSASSQAKLNIYVDKQGVFPDYMVFGVIDWHFRMQRPQHLARAFSELGRRVFYISSNIIHSDKPGFHVEPLDSSGRLFQINVFAKGAPSIYSERLSEESISQLKISVGEVMGWADCKQVISMVDHPSWFDVARVIPNNRLIFDCMDHHEGFGSSSANLLRLEERLINEADKVISTSAWLDEKIRERAKESKLIRNAADYEHFSTAPEEVYKDSLGRKIIGYYGAIASWFDIELIRLVAKREPNCCVLLIGEDTIKAQQQLAGVTNVTFIGEVEYTKLPYYLYGFDVCLLPFNVEPLTLATNPVKIYEYFCASKPVVTVNLPEMAQFDNLLYTAESKKDFVEAVSHFLNKGDSPEAAEKRKLFSKSQTWLNRSKEVVNFVENYESEPTVSVVVVTYNNLPLTKTCLQSLDKYSDYQNMELIVVDNDSGDGSKEYLLEWAKEGSNRTLILNETNQGFAAANNQGMQVSKGEYLVLLNNDTHVTNGWVRSLVGHLKRDPSIGLIGPVTNNIGNEAKIKINYNTMEEMLTASSLYCFDNIGKSTPLTTAAFFCVMMRRDVFTEVGELDEVYGRGFFEDDDYCRRVEALGYRICCAEDVFIHHELSASFDKLKIKDRQKLFNTNKKTYEAKWGEWVPHRLRDGL